MPNPDAGERHGEDAAVVRAHPELDVVASYEAGQRHAQGFDQPLREAEHPPSVVVHRCAVQQPIQRIRRAKVKAGIQRLEPSGLKHDGANLVQRRGLNRIQHVSADGEFAACEAEERPHAQQAVRFQHHVVIEKADMADRGVVHRLDQPAPEAAGPAQVSLLHDTQPRPEPRCRLRELGMRRKARLPLVHDDHAGDHRPKRGVPSHARKHGRQLGLTIERADDDTEAHLRRRAVTRGPLRIRQGRWVLLGGEVEPQQAALTEVPGVQGERQVHRSGDELLVQQGVAAMRGAPPHPQPCVPVNLQPQADRRETGVKAPLILEERVEVGVERCGGSSRNNQLARVVQAQPVGRRGPVA